MSVIKIKIDGVEHKVNPQLTVEKYQIITKDPKRFEDQSEILSLYLDISADELRDLPVDQISFIDKLLVAHQMEPSSDLIFTFKHEGVTYGLENDWGNMTWSQWTDMEVFSQPDKLVDSIHIILALLYRPVEKQKGDVYKLVKYKSKEVLDRAEIFKKIPIQLWFSAANFFFLISKESVTNINRSLKRRAKQKERIQKLMNWGPMKLLPNKQRDSFTNSLINLLRRI